MNRQRLVRAAEMSIRFGEFGQQIRRGQAVDFDRVVGKLKRDGKQVDVTVGSLLEGRHDLFVPDAAAPEAKSQAPAPLDIDDDQDHGDQ